MQWTFEASRGLLSAPQAPPVTSHHTQLEMCVSKRDLRPTRQQPPVSKNNGAGWAGGDHPQDCHICFLLRAQLAAQCSFPSWLGQPSQPQHHNRLTTPKKASSYIVSAHLAQHNTTNNFEVRMRMVVATTIKANRRYLNGQQHWRICGMPSAGKHSSPFDCCAQKQQKQQQQQQPGRTTKHLHAACFALLHLAAVHPGPSRSRQVSHGGHAVRDGHLVNHRHLGSRDCVCMIPHDNRKPRHLLLWIPPRSWNARVHVCIALPRQRTPALDRQCLVRQQTAQTTTIVQQSRP